MRFRLRSLAAALLVLTMSAQSNGFLIQTYEGDDGPVGLRWTTDTVRYILSAAGSDDMPSQAAFAAIRAAFEVWTEVPTSRIVFESGGVETGATANRRDRRNVIIFDETGRTLSAPAGSGVIAVTRLNSDVATGAITDADIIYNGRDFTFAIEPVGDQIDLLDVTVHEIGHFFGLNHTPLAGSAVTQPSMNPFYSGTPGAASSLAADDIAGISTLYPTSDHTRSSGTISGIVTDASGGPVFGAHVVAQSVDGSLISTLSGAEHGRESPGTFTLRGLAPGDYTVRIEPFSHGITEENFGGIFTNLATDIQKEFFDNVTEEGLAQVITLPAGALRNLRGIDFVTGLALPGYPSVTSIAHPSNTPDTAGPYRVEIQATDVEQILLTMQIEAGGQIEDLSVPMQPNGAQSYAIAIPGQPVGSQIRYRVAATGTEGRVTYFPGQTTWVDFDVVSLTGAPLAFAVMRSAGAVRIFDTGNDREVSRISVGEDPIQIVSSLDGNRVFVADLTASQVVVVERATFRVIARIPVATAPLDMTISADGTTLYVTNSDVGRLTAIDTQELAVVASWIISESTAGPYGVTTGASGHIYVTDLRADEVIIFDAGRVVDRLQGPTSPRALSRSGDGATIYVSSFNSGLLGKVDDETRAVSIVDLGVQGTFAVLAHPTRDLLFLTAHLDGLLLVLEASSGAIIDQVGVGNDPRGLSLSPDGERLYVTSASSDEIHVIDTGTTQILGVYQAAGGPRGIAVVESPVVETVIVEDTTQPTTWALSALYPNPFNPEVQLELIAGGPGTAHLFVYNVLGQRVGSVPLMPAVQAGQRLVVRWDGRDRDGHAVATGVYVFVVDTPEGRLMRKGLLMR
jgi:YVTN family beta-propeller protein